VWGNSREQAELNKVQTSICEGSDNNGKDFNFKLIILQCETSSRIVSNPLASSHSNDTSQHMANSKVKL
jgi:hypothetical protein